MSEQLGEIRPTTHDTVWIATARLHKKNSDVRDIFTVQEIFNEVKNLNLITVSDQTIKQHISSHCVANTSESPEYHRYLYRVDIGRYRLFKPGNYFNNSRKYGKMHPKKETIPHQFRFLVDWYVNEYSKESSKEFQITSPNLVNPPYARISGNSITIPSEIKK